MSEMMKAVVISADWDPRPTYKPTSKDIAGKLTYLGSQVWRNPRLSIEERPKPEIGPTDILIKVRACGICGSDVHMSQKDEDGYMLYPGLTAFPATLGHEFSGEVVEAGEFAVNKRTGKRYEMGEAVCVEEMLWCG
ncbi:MAG: alcohol dehydrogenase catalytic domain-containing protein, partial [Spirochaetales bacterium]|nr:alcohol dehydrogenase catalytic domain-containing protein [Spirochaetales bacterium]